MNCFFLNFSSNIEKIKIKPFKCTKQKQLLNNKDDVVILTTQK